jgi:hypothetical protein
MILKQHGLFIYAPLLHVKSKCTFALYQTREERELIVQRGELAMTGLAADGIKQMPGNQATAAASRLIR